jgi:hypothetical protein
VAVLVPLAVACGDDGLDVDSARSCDELVDAAADVTRGVLRDVAGLTMAELQVDDAADPFAALREPYAGFEERATELGCGEAELTRLACESYPDVVDEASGEVAEAFLADYYAACD